MAPKQHLTMEETVNDLSKRVNRIMIFLVLSYVISFSIIATEWLNSRETKAQFNSLNITVDTVQSNQKLIMQQDQRLADSLQVTNDLLRDQHGSTTSSGR